MGCETPACTCRNNLLTSQSSNIPFHVSSHLISPHLFQSHLVSSRLMFSYLLYLFVPLICFTSPRISSHVVSSLLSSSRLIWSRLILFQFINSSHRISSFLIVSTFSALCLRIFAILLFTAALLSASRLSQPIPVLSPGYYGWRAQRLRAKAFSNAVNAVLLYSCSCHFLPLEVGCWQMFCCSSFSRAICQKVEAIKSKVPWA